MKKFSVSKPRLTETAVVSQHKSVTFFNQVPRVSQGFAQLHTAASSPRFW